MWRSVLEFEVFCILEFGINFILKKTFRRYCLFIVFKNTMIFFLKSVEDFILSLFCF